MITLKDELTSLKADFISLQNFLKDKISSLEFKINDIESKISVEYYAKNETVVSVFPVQELDNQTRNIVEELMWESTLSQSAIRVREIFKDVNGREKFLRCCLEMVLEKDEQYRKMAGTLFGHLINQNIINQTNVFNSLSSVLLVIENSNNYDTKMWRNLTEILLPMIMDSHIKLLQVQRRAQTILKQEYYCEFIEHLCGAIESSRKHKFKPKSSDAVSPLAHSASYTAPTAGAAAAAVAAEKPDFNVDLPDDCAIDLQNLYDVESMSKFKPCLDALPLDENLAQSRSVKYNVDRLLRNLTSSDVDDAIGQMKQIDGAEMKSLLEDVFDEGVQREPEQRLHIGSLISRCIGERVCDAKQVIGAFCKSIFKLQRLVVNPNTRGSTCCAFVDLLLPLFADGRLKFAQLSSVAATALPEEPKTIFLWCLEKALNDKGLSEATSALPPSAVATQLMKRMRKFMGRTVQQPDESCDNEPADAATAGESKAGGSAPLPPARVTAPRKLSPVRLEKRDWPRQAQMAPPSRTEAEAAYGEEPSEHEKFLNLKRKKLLKERIENAGDKTDIKIDDLLQDPANRKLQDGETGGDPQQKIDGSKADGEQAPTKQPENLPSSAIKEKMQEIIEQLMGAANMDECVTTVKETFNECQTDLVFKAAFEYTKDKSSEYRIQSGRLVSEAFKHDPRRIGAQIMNTISLELGDFVDVPELWNGMAEIICPPMLNGLIRFVDLKLLPKYFLHTNHCASLLLAIFRQIIQQCNVEWLEDNWKKSKLDLTTFLPLNNIYKFVTDNKLEFLVKDEQMAQYKENAG